MSTAEILAHINARSIRQLTNALHGITPRELDVILGQLQRARLLTPPSRAAQSAVDTHAIVREHFRDVLKFRHPEAWKQGNRLLFERYARSCPGVARNKRQALTIYSAIRHGCRAGQFQAALRVYQHRIHRATHDDSVVRRHGLFSDDLTALYAFFDLERGVPVKSLRAHDRRFVLEQTATRLRWVGRLAECCTLMEQVLVETPNRASPETLAVPLRYLAECRLMRGELEDAKVAATRAVAAARRGKRWIDHVAATSILAATLHHAGAAQEASRLFDEAERIQAANDQLQPYLHSVRGFRYHEFLLDQDQFDEVVKRCTFNLQRTQRHHIEDVGPVDIGICWLGIGLARLRQGQQRCTAGQRRTWVAEARDAITRCVGVMEDAGRLEYVYHACLARAELQIFDGDYDAAAQELEYVVYEAEHDEMSRIVAEGRLLLAAVNTLVGSTEKAGAYLRLVHRDVRRLGFKRLVHVKQRLGLQWP